MSVFDITDTADDQSSWHFDALCRQFDADPWHAEKGEGYEELKAQAKSICQQCPVINTCLAEHLTEKYGIWGGLTPNERATLRANLRRSAA
jgi:WhiB family redox-sensing transcriptional regulator